MTDFVCKTCGGPVKTTYFRCRYCGGSISFYRELSEEDINRMKAFASGINSSLWMNGFRYSLISNYIFVFSGIVIFFLYTLMLFGKTGSLLLTIISMFLIAGLMACAYKSIFWFEMLNKVIMKKVYENKIEPEINFFLKSYNYFAWEFEKIVRNMNLEIREIIPAPVDARSCPDKIDSFVSYINLQISEEIFNKQSRWTVILCFIAAYLMLMTIPLYFQFFSMELIPLAWIVPFFIFLYLNLLEKLPGKFKIQMEMLISHPGKNFIKKELFPMIREYCAFMGIEYTEIISKSYLIYEDNLSKILINDPGSKKVLRE